LGRGISDSLTIGVTINANDARLDNNAFDMDRGFGAAIWGAYNASGAARTGLQLSGTIGYMRNEGDLARGRLLTDVVVATGKATLDTRAVRASLGYGFEHSDWLITPNLSVAHYETTRSAYIETGADFNARYDEMRTNRTVLTLGVSGEYPVSAQGRLSLGAGVEHEVNSERLRLTGASDILGLATFDIESSFNPNRTRIFVTAGYTHYFGNGSAFSGDVRVAQATYGNTASVGLSVTYATRF
jgi:hypothetical protein